MRYSNKALKMLILPLIVEQILVMLVGMADTMMISYAGEAAISGVALVDMVNNLIITILSAVATGGAVIIAQYLGSKDKKNASYAASQLLTITVIISTVIMVICLLLHRMILKFLFGSIENNVMEAAITYFWVSALSFPFLGIYNTSAALFRSMGKTKTTMYVSLLMNVINVVGNSIGIFLFHAGVIGVAIPTLISRAVASFIMVYLAFDMKNEVHICLKEILSWNKSMIRRILHIAVPNGIENGLFMLGKVLVTSIVSLFGTTQIAANGVANSVDYIVIIVVNAINMSIVTIVGQCVGARDYEQTRYYIKKLMIISYVATGILNIVVLIFLRAILGFFTLSQETYHLSVLLIIMHNVLALLLHPTSFILSNGLRAAGDVRFTMYVGIGSMIVFRLGSAVLFGIIFNMGVVGVWIAMGTDWLFRSIAFTIRFRSGKWKEYRAI